MIEGDDHSDIRDSARKLCLRFDGAYWRKLDQEPAYPTEFVAQLGAAGFLALLIPQQYGGSGLGLSAACAVLEEIQRSGCNGGACHAQMYTLLRHGSEEQKLTYLPKIASGELRLQAFGVTEPNSGTDTTRIQTFAEKIGDRYRINGQKGFISRAEHSDLMILLAAIGNGLTIKPINTMMSHACTELFFDNLEVPAKSLLGIEGKGFGYILDGMNEECILIAAECIGDARFFIDRATSYANERQVFGRPIGQNQGIQFPIARAYAQTEAAALLVDKAADLFDAERACGAEATIAKMLASEASWAAGDTCVQTHGGYGFAAEYDIARKFRETRLYQVAPISINLILSFIATKVLNMPRSF